jgi:hypothetical protein
MTDTKSVSEAEDTGLSEAEQPAEETDLESDELTFEDLVGKSEDDEAATESTEDEQSEEPDVTEAEVVEESQETDTEAEAEGEDTDPEAERKRFNAEMAQRRIAEKKAREEAQEAKQALEAERLQRYLSEAEGDDELLAERQREVQTYQIQVERANLNAQRLELGIEKALAEIDLFKTGSQAIRDELLNSLDEFERYNVVKDNQGRPIEVKGDVYQHLVKKADSIRKLTQAGAVLEAETRNQAKARAITPPTRTPKAPKTNKDLDDFDRAIGW